MMQKGLLDEMLEGAFEDGGPKGLRNYKDTIIKILIKILII